MKGFGELPSKRGKNIARQSTNSIGQNYYHNAIDYHRRGDLKRAEKEYRKAISSGYKHDAIYLNLGVICKNSARADEAAYLYKKCIEVFPEKPNAYLNLSILYKESGDLDQALKCILRYIKLRPTDSNARIHLVSSTRTLECLMMHLLQP